MQPGGGRYVRGIVECDHIFNYWRSDPLITAWQGNRNRDVLLFIRSGCRYAGRIVSGEYDQLARSICGIGAAGFDDCSGGLSIAAVGKTAFAPCVSGCFAGGVESIQKYFSEPESHLCLSTHRNADVFQLSGYPVYQCLYGDKCRYA